MFPIGDRNPTRTTPFVNYALIGLNVVAFLFQSWLSLAGGEAWVVPGYGLVASRFFADVPGEFFTLFTSMFMHGGWGHLASNLLFLHVFGDNVEDAIGHVRYVFFYLLCGVAAGLAQVATSPLSSIPMVGASGAIAGVLGAYMVLYPRAPVTVVNPVPLLWLFFGLFIELPAWVMAGVWFLLQLVNAVFSLTESLGLGTDGGVAFFAHVGGFVAGLLVVKPLCGRRERGEEARWSGWRPPPRERRPEPRPRFGDYR
jgi:membrane associated rhomboid family serine protease